MKNSIAFTQLFLRLALGVSFIGACFDRFGWVAPHGSANVSWGDWRHFLFYSHQLMPFVPVAIADWLAIAATILEVLCGILLIIGLFTQFASIVSGIMLLSFGVSMAISLGIHTALSYSVFTARAAAFALATVPVYKWSIDEIISSKKAESMSVIQLF